MSAWHDRFSKKLWCDVAGSVRKGGVKLARVPRIIIPPREFARLQSFIDQYDREIAGLGSVIELDNGDLFIEKIFLVEQSDNTGVHVDISDGAVKLMTEMDARGESPERLRCRWHSHVHMESIFSDVDEKAATGFGGDYLIDIVGNKRGEFDVRLYFRKPIPMRIDNLPLYLDYVIPSDVRDEVKAEIRTFVKQTVLGAARRIFGVGEPPRMGLYEEYNQSSPTTGATNPYVPYRGLEPPRKFGEPKKSLVAPASDVQAPKTEPAPLPPPVDKITEPVVENSLIVAQTTDENVPEDEGKEV